MSDENSFKKLLEGFSNTIHSWKDIIHIGYTRAPDAMIAASIIGRMLYAQKRPFVLFELSEEFENQEQMKEGKYFILIGVDIDQIANEEFSSEIIYIVKPSKKTSDVKNIINSGEFGYFKPNITLGAISFLLCFEYVPTIEYILQLALVSLQTVDMMGEYSDILSNIKEVGLKEECIKIDKSLSILGSGIFSISEALHLSQVPFLPGLTGNNENITQLLAKAGIVEETREGVRTLNDLDKEEIKSLNSEIVKFLVDYKRHQEDNLLLIKDKTVFPQERNNTITRNSWDFARSLIDVNNREEYGTGMSVLMGDRSDNLKRLSNIFKEERRALSLSFDLLRDKVDDIVDLQYLRYLVTNRKINWYNTSLVAAMGLSNGLVRIDLPFAIISPGPKSDYTIGIRASKHHNTGPGLLPFIKELLSDNDDFQIVDGSKLMVEIRVNGDNWKDLILKINKNLGDLN